MAWRDKVDPAIKNFLEMQIRESARYKPVYSLSENPSNAQLWIAVANLSKQNFDLNLKIKILENALKDFLSKERAKEQEKNKDKKTSKLEKSLRRF